MSDDSRADLYLRKDGSLQTLIQEGVPVYAAKSTKISNSTTCVPITVNLLSSNSHDPRSNLYYEDHVRDKKIESLDGIISQDDDELFVICKKIVKTNHDVEVKEGEQVGIVSTVIEIDDIDSPEETWTLPEMRKDIELGVELYDDQELKVYVLSTA